MGVHGMGRFGILAGFVASAALALSLVGGGGFGNLSIPVVAETGTATPPSSSLPEVSRHAVSIPSAPGAPSVEPAVASPIAETLDATSASDVAPDSTAVTVAADPSPSADGEFTVVGEFDAAAAALPFADAVAASGSSSSPWDSADKQAAPNQIHPAYLSADPETIARVQALAAQGKSCPGLGGYTSSGAPSKRSGQGVAGTTSADLISFADQYNLIRYQNCLPPVTRFVYDSCMEARLFWMAESPSPDPLDAWGHMGSTRIDGVPSVGCDGNLAGGTANTGATVATKWWQSLSHRASLYRPPNSTAGVCVALAMTHGGIDEPTSFTRAAASWRSC